MCLGIKVILLTWFQVKFVWRTEKVQGKDGCSEVNGQNKEKEEAAEKEE